MKDMIAGIKSSIAWFAAIMYVCCVPLYATIMLAQAAPEISNYFHIASWMIYVSVLIIDIPYIIFAGMLFIGVFGIFMECVIDFLFVNKNYIYERISKFITIEQN